MATTSVPTNLDFKPGGAVERAVADVARHDHAAVYDHATCTDPAHPACHGQVRVFLARDYGAGRWLWSVEWRALPISDHHPRGTSTRSANGHAPDRGAAIVDAYAAFTVGPTWPTS